MDCAGRSSRALTTCRKIRHGDLNVEGCTRPPCRSKAAVVLLDDMVSTGHTVARGAGAARCGRNQRTSRSTCARLLTTLAMMHGAGIGRSVEYRLRCTYDERGGMRRPALLRRCAALTVNIRRAARRESPCRMVEPDATHAAMRALAPRNTKQRTHQRAQTPP